MSDYEGRISLYIDGLDKLDKLDQKLQKAVFLLAKLEQAEISVGRSAESSSGRLEKANQRREKYTRSIQRAESLRQQIEGKATRQSDSLKIQSEQIAKQSRINYLTNTADTRRQEFVGGGSGASLSPELQKQAANIQSAFDAASRKGREDLRLMQALNTEMSGILKKQDQLNRTGLGRSAAFESARKGQERIDSLASRPEADARKIRRIRTQASDIIEATQKGDLAGARDATRRMNASIERYRRELDLAAASLRQQKVASAKQFNVRQSWRAVSAEAQEIARAPKALPSSAMLAERISRTPGGEAPARLDDQKKRQEKLAAEASRSLEQAVGSARKIYSEALSSSLKKDGETFADALGRYDQIAREKLSSYSQDAEKGLADFDRRLQNREKARKTQQKLAAEGMKGLEKATASSERIYSSAASQATKRDDRSFKDDLAEYNKRAKRELDLYRDQAEKELADFDRRLQSREKAKKAARSSSPFQGSLRQAVGEGLIGGGFPLLFGQGAGASAGGLAGGFAGGLIGGSFGFGLSIAGTAVGQVIDDTVKNLSTLAGSLKSPKDALAALETNGLRVSDSLKFQVEQLQSVGRAYDAQTLVLQEVEKRLGSGSVRSLNALSSEQAKLENQWSSITSTLQSGLIPALTGVVAVVNDLLSAAKSIREVPGLKQAGEAYNKTSASQKLLLSPIMGPGVALQGLFQLAQDRGRRISATSAGNRRPLSPQEAYADESRRLQESRGIADQVKSAYREAFALQRQAYDLQRDGAQLNKDVADFSYRKEQEIFGLRQRAAEKRIENTRAAAQGQIERGDLGARRAFASAGGFEQQLLTNVRESVRIRKEGEADIRESRSRLELAMARLNRDAQDYKRTTAREIEDIELRKLAYVRSVEDYKMKVADYILERSRQSADLMRQAMTLPDMGIGGGTAGRSNGETVAISLMNRLNLTPAQASGVVGNFMRESGQNVDPRLNEGGVSGLPARRGGYGIAQWTGSRQDSLIRFAGSSEKAGDLQTQINFLIKELQTDYAGALRSLKKAGTPEEAARVFEKDYEKAGVKALGERQANARRFYNSFNPSSMAMGPAMGGTVALTGRTGIGSGAHLDARWADGRPISAADVDAFVRVGGKKPSSYGVTSGYGPRVAPVPGASTFHRGIDFGTPENKPISLVGGARLTGSMTENESGGGGVVGIIDTPLGKMKLLHLNKILKSPQASGAAQIGRVEAPQFRPTPIGAMPSAAPINAERMKVLAQMSGGEKEAQRILEDQIKLRQKGVELGQIEQILQSTQLPQLQQQGEALKGQIDARQRILDLSDNAVSVADIEAEAGARLAQIERDRVSALKKATAQFKGDLAVPRQINDQADAAVKVARAEEEQRKENLKLANQNSALDRGRVQILQLQETLTAGRAEAAALERGELQASALELLKASSLYRDASDAQKNKLAGLVLETDELRKQNEFRRRLNEVAQDTRFVGTGVRSGFIGAPARAFEQELKASGGNVDQATEIANRTKKLEDQRVVWENLEKDIVKTSEAISGALTNGLLDVISGSKTLADVGRETLNTIARSFADSAQQQLSVITQRQLNGLLGGPEGPLTRALGAGGAGAEMVGPQVLGTAASAAAGSVGTLGSAAVAAAAALQTIAANATIFGAMGGGPSAMAGFGGKPLSGAVGSIISSFSQSVSTPTGAFGASGLSGITNGFLGNPLSGLLGSFGGFFAEGGVTRPGKGYVVGEKEPEFFFPGVTGRVVPKSDMEKAAQLRQADSQPSTIDIRYSVTEQQGVRYVTEEQFKKGMDRTTKRAQAMTYAGMRNNKNVRDSLNI